MKTSFDLIDDDGNVIPCPPPDSPVAMIVWLIEYGRKRKFRIGPTVQIGDVIVQVKDLREESHERRVEPDVAPGSDMAVLLGLDE